MRTSTPPTLNLLLLPPLRVCVSLHRECVRCMLRSRSSACSQRPSFLTPVETVRDGTAASPLLGPLLDKWGDVFAMEVLQKWLDPTDCAMLARACWKCGEAVAAAAGLACAEDSAVVPLVPLKVEQFVRSVQLLAWAMANKCPWNARVCARAADGGHLEVLQWAREHDCPWDKWTCANAAQGGRLELLMWARVNDCPWDEETTTIAATFGHIGHIAVLQWAREHHCPWNEDTCAHAASGGHLEVLIWAREHGCPWDEDTCGLAATFGHLAVLQWAWEHHCPWNDRTSPLSEGTCMC